MVNAEAPDTNVAVAPPPEEAVLAALPELFLNTPNVLVLVTVKVPAISVGPPASGSSVVSALEAVVCEANSLLGEPSEAEPVAVVGEPEGELAISETTALDFVVDATADDVLLDATAEVTTALGAFCQTDTTHSEASLLSTNLPFCFFGVKLRV